MDVLKKGIDDLRFKIPRQILEKTFLDRGNSWKPTIGNIDECIMSTVIRPRVLVDCNLVGGVEITIDLAGVPKEMPDLYTSVYRIPKKATQGKSILSVLTVNYINMNTAAVYPAYATLGTNPMLRGAQTMFDSMANIPVTGTARATLIGENVVMVKDSIIIPDSGYMRCIVANDDRLSHINPRSYLEFSKLIEFAVKSYIYNHLIIQLGEDELIGGQSLGVFKQIVEGYADAEELYETHLKTVIGKVSFMNDLESYTRFIKKIVGKR